MLGFRARNTQAEKSGSEGSESPAASEVRTTPLRDATAAQQAASGTPQGPVMPKRLGTILVEERLVAQEHIEEALEYQQKHGGFLGQILVDMGYLKQNDLVLCLVKQCHIPHISLLDYDIAKEVLQLIPKEVCQKHDLIPIDKLGRILTVAMANPLDTVALDEIRKLCPDLRIKPILCDWQHLKTVFSRTFGATRNDLDTTYLALGPKRQFQAATEAPCSPEMSAQMDAVAEELIRQSLTAAEPERESESLQFDVTEMARESVGGALQEAMANMMVGAKEKERSPETTLPADASTLSPDALNRAIRESMASVVQEAMAELSVQTKTQAPTVPSTELHAMIRESVAAAVQDAIRAQTPAPPVETAGEDRTALRAVVQEMLRDEETATVALTNLQDLKLHDAERAKRQKHTSVSSFIPTRAAVDGLEARLESDEHVLAAMNSDRVLDEFRFDSFVVGKGNVFTVKLCRAVAAQPGGDYNPLFVYGDVGLGKTHLINAIGNAIAAAHPDARVGYISSSRFATRLAEALKDGAADAFRANYCHWDVLILDDIQFLGGRVEAQEEFFHIFNVLQQQRRQIIIAGDKPPDRLGMLEQRLISRFSGGIVASVRPPEFEARMAILKKQMAQSSIALPDEVLALVATRVTHDMRKMIGAFRKILAYANLLEGQVSCETANDILLQLGIDEAA